MQRPLTGNSLLFLLLVAAPTPVLALDLIRVGPCQIAIENGDKAEDMFIPAAADQVFWLGKSTAYNTKGSITADDRKVLADVRKQCATDQTGVLQRSLRIPTASTRNTGRWAIADLNNDTRLDSVLAGGNGVLIQMAQNDRQLGTGTRLNLGSQTHVYSSVAIADVNKDGKPDLILCCTSLGPDSKLAIALGNGDGTFQAARDSIPANGAFAVTDWNADGRPDVITLTPTPSLTLALGQADGTLAVTETMQAAGLSVIVADGNGDQRLDAIVLSQTAVTVFPGQADGKFGTSVSTNLFFNHPQSVSAADFNGDGKIDLAVSHQFGLTEILSGDQFGRFLSTGTFSTSQFARSFAADLNDDGVPELLLPDPSGGAQIVLVNSAGRPIASPLYGVPPDGNIFPDYDPTRSAMAVADFNRDLKPDIAFIAATQNSAALMVLSGANGLANLTVAAPVNIASINAQRVFIHSLLVMDYDGDGRPDLLALEAETQSLWMFHNRFQGGFDLPTAIPLGSQPRAMAIADFNSDGRLDLAVSVGPNTPGTGKIHIFYGTSSGTLILSQTINTGATPYRLTVNDFNGDFKPDLAFIPVAPNGNLAAGIVLTRNDNTFGDSTAISLKPYASIGLNPSLDAIASADVNGDGSMDIVVGARFTDGPLGVLLGNGKGAFTALSAAADVAPGIADILLTDLDSDGNLDLLAAHCCGDTSTRYYFGRGDGTFSRPHLYPTGSHTDRIMLSDLNNDGQAEIVARTYSGISVTSLLIGKQVGVSSTASGRGPTLALDSIASAYGTNLADLAASASLNPFEIAGTRVSVIDALGNINNAPLFFVSPGQVNFLIPASVAEGNATVVVQPFVFGQIRPPAFADITVARVVPGLFVVDTTRLVAANVIRVKATGQQIAESPYRLEGVSIQGVPIDLGPEGETVVLVLYGTGIRNRASLSQVKVTIGGLIVDPFFANAQTEFPGLDQVNVIVPRSLAGRGSVDVAVSVAGQASNAGRVIIK